MLYREMTKKIADFFLKEQKSALMITGARQVGKTTCIREYAKENYKNVIEINFIEMPEQDEFDLILRSVDDIHADIQNKRDNDLLIFEECKVDHLTGDLTGIESTRLEETGEMTTASTGEETGNTVETKIDNTENPALSLSEAIEKLKELSDKNANI